MDEDGTLQLGSWSNLKWWPHKFQSFPSCLEKVKGDAIGTTYLNHGGFSENAQKMDDLNRVICSNIFYKSCTCIYSI